MTGDTKNMLLMSDEKDDNTLRSSDPAGKDGPRTENLGCPEQRTPS